MENIIPQIGLNFRRIMVEGWRGRERGEMVQLMVGAFGKRNIRV